MTLSLQVIDSMTSESITKKEYDTLLSLIHNRVDVIWKEICLQGKHKLKWYSFDNDEHAYDNDGNGSDGGEFDPKEYRDYISLIGEYACSIDTEMYQYREGFPTALLWDKDYKKTIADHIAECKQDDILAKQQKKEKATMRKQKRVELIASIRSKLTPEEWRIVKFK